MRKTLAFTCIAIMVVMIWAIFFLPFSGNRIINDTTCTYRRAIIYFPNGESKELVVDSWRDYEGKQIQIKDINGTVYLVNSVNCVLISE